MTNGTQRADESSNPLANFDAEDQAQSSFLPDPVVRVIVGLALLVSGYGTFRYFTDYTKEPWKQADPQ